MTAGDTIHPALRSRRYKPGMERGNREAGFDIPTAAAGVRAAIPSASM
jgi:hypothetical protein